MKILTLYDNHAIDPNLKADHGLAVLISINDYNLLFDTGTKGEILLANMKKLGVEPKEIDEIMISHDHDDHYGGLADVLAKNNQVKVYVLSTEIQTKNVIKDAGAQIIEIDKPTTITEKVYTSGSLGVDIKEHSLILDTEEGLVIITGCAHSGIIDIIKTVKNQFPNKEICLVMGGFHLFHLSRMRVKEIIKDFKDLGVRKVAPSHCNGDEPIRLFKEFYQDNFITIGVGKTIKF